MANIEVKLRRGTDTEHSSFTGAEGEVTVDTTNDTLRVHDGSTAGGIRLAKLSEVSGGTGTVTSVASGTGLTGGPITTSGTLSIADNGVTFAKMQDINTAKVIGRTTVGSGNPEEVSILDDDTMATASAISLATSESIKAYVDTQVAASTVSKYSSEWFNDTTGLSNDTAYTFTHNLGTSEIIVEIWMAKSNTGTDAVKVERCYHSGLNREWGATVNAIAANTLQVQLLDQWITFDTSGARTDDNWGTTYTHIKVVAIG